MIAAGRDSLSSSELLERADLAGQALVLSVKKSPDRSSHHVVRLRFELILKGTPRFSSPLAAWFPFARTVEVKLRPVARDANGDALPGQWSAGYRAGDRVMTHLVWNAELGSYTTLSWNSVWQVPR